MCSKLSQVDTMSWVLLTVVSLYIAMVNPSNTPAFFSNPVFKFILFAFVAVVFVLEGPLVGTLFGIAMVLPVVYSSLREGYQNPFIERYNDGEKEEEGKEGETEKTDEDDMSTEVMDDAEDGEDGAEKEGDGADADTKEADKDATNDLSKLLKEVDEIDTTTNTSDQDTVPSGAQEEEPWSNYARVF